MPSLTAMFAAECGRSLGTWRILLEAVIVIVRISGDGGWPGFWPIELSSFDWMKTATMLMWRPTLVAVWCLMSRYPMIMLRNVCSLIKLQSALMKYSQILYWRFCLSMKMNLSPIAVCATMSRSTCHVRLRRSWVTSARDRRSRMSARVPVRRRRIYRRDVWSWRADGILMSEMGHQRESNWRVLWLFHGQDHKYDLCGAVVVKRVVMLQASALTVCSRRLLQNTYPGSKRINVRKWMTCLWIVWLLDMHRWTGIDHVAWLGQ